MERGDDGAPGRGPGERKRPAAPEPARPLRADPARRRRVRRDLEARGLPATLAGPLSECLGRVAPELSGEAYDAVLSGVTLAYGAKEGPEEGRPQPREVERLMERMGDELQKLDEGLRTLGAIVERIRSRSPAPPDATLH